MRALHAFLLPVLFSACNTPPIQVQDDRGVVRAVDPDVADQVAHTIAHFAPRVKERLGSTREDPPEVWVVSRIPGTSAQGGCAEDRIYVATDALPYRPVIEIHELVHWFVPESPFEQVPPFIEEGLAEYLAYESVGLSELRKRMAEGEKEFNIPLFIAKRPAWRKLPKAQRESLCHIGYAVVALLGVEGVRELAERRAGPLEYVHAAGLSPDLAAMSFASALD